MYLTMIISEPEDGHWNYLFERKNHHWDRQHSISYELPYDLGLKPGDSFWANVEAECKLIYAVDPTPPIFEGSLLYGNTRLSYICNATRITRYER